MANVKYSQNNFARLNKSRITLIPYILFLHAIKLIFFHEFFQAHLVAL